MPEPPPVTGFIDLRKSAATIGHLAWVEVQLFQMLGSWVQSVPELDVKLALAQQSYHHAWHAELLQDRLPVLHDLDPTSLVIPANGKVAEVVGTIAGANGSEQTIEKLVGVFRVLVPAKIAAYEAWLAGSSAVSDGPLRRALGFVLTDERADRLDGEALIAALPGDGALSARADAWAAKLGAALKLAGPIGGSNDH